MIRLLFLCYKMPFAVCTQMISYALTIKALKWPLFSFPSKHVSVCNERMKKKNTSGGKKAKKGITVTAIRWICVSCQHISDIKYPLLGKCSVTLSWQKITLHYFHQNTRWSQTKKDFWRYTEWKTSHKNWSWKCCFYNTVTAAWIKKKLCLSNLIWPCRLLE